MDVDCGVMAVAQDQSQVHNGSEIHNGDAPPSG